MTTQSATQTNASKFYEQWPSKAKNMHSQAPDASAAFGTMFGKLMGDGALSVREKELIALAIGMALRCEPCIYSHVQKCVKAGATRDQLTELAGVVITMQGGPGYVYVPKLLEALDALNVE
ncbi:MAG: carboxymuconolactone decarboxylase family protein [Phycisphaerales bacterium]|nr:carboxymuconolactone decarboxylase family protein [Phycisphaerales bacterium]